jgi:putative membrane protein
MTFEQTSLTLGGLCLLLLSATIAVRAADVSQADRMFVAKVSQGGMYEVEAGKLAETKGVSQDIKDQGSTEVHDHTLVGEKLKSITRGNDIEYPSRLNSEFQSRLYKLRNLAPDKFDAAYIDDMKKIHAGDGAAFEQEATSGTNAQLKAFAEETDRIVKRHIGELDANVP